MGRCDGWSWEEGSSVVNEVMVRFMSCSEEGYMWPWVLLQV